MSSPIGPGAPAERAGTRHRRIPVRGRAAGAAQRARIWSSIGWYRRSPIRSRSVSPLEISCSSACSRASSALASELTTSSLRSRAWRRASSVGFSSTLSSLLAAMPGARSRPGCPRSLLQGHPRGASLLGVRRSSSVMGLSHPRGCWSDRWPFDAAGRPRRRRWGVPYRRRRRRAIPRRGCGNGPWPAGAPRSRPPARPRGR